MRFGHWRGVMLAVALFSSMAAGRMAIADGFHHTIPREVLARDLTTGEPYYAPAIPWGHYAKSGHCDHFGKGCSPCKLCFGKGCGHCGGRGCLGGLLGGLGHGGGGGLGGGCGGGLLGGLGHKGCGGGLLGGHGPGGDCEGGGCGRLGGLGSRGGMGSGDGCGDAGCGGHGRRVKDCGLCKGKGCGVCRSSEVGEAFHAQSSGQSPASSQGLAPRVTPIVAGRCPESGCNLGPGHRHGGSSMGEPCDGCGGKGCGKCHGLGRLFGGLGGGGGIGGGAGNGDLCGSCGGKGCGLCGGLGRLLKKACGMCGGKGCGHCGMGGHLKGKLAGLFHHGGIKYFVGPGGPVPLTPGYVPYVVPTRSPRDFLAFPPYTPDGF